MKSEDVINDLTGALQWLLDDLADAGEDRSPGAGEYYDSVAHAHEALARGKQYVQSINATKEGE